MNFLRRRIGILLLAGLLVVSEGRSVAAASDKSGFNDEYVFATTKSVSDMDMNPALKVTLIPATVVLDTVFLPFAIIAGFVA